MKTFEKIKGFVVMGIAAVMNFLFEVESKAQLIKGSTDSKTALEKVEDQVKNTTGKVVDIALIAVGLISVIIVVWGLAKKKKGDNNANDAIVDGAMYSGLAAILILMIKTLFFGNV